MHIFPAQCRAVWEAAKRDVCWWWGWSPNRICCQKDSQGFCCINSGQRITSSTIYISKLPGLICSFSLISRALKYIDTFNFETWPFWVQYPAGTPEVSSIVSENSGNSGQRTLGVATTGAQIGYKHTAFMGSCKHHLWQAIRASSAAPYYLDDFSDGINSPRYLCICFLYILLLSASQLIAALTCKVHLSFFP